mgnify:CR=1 FL=1
MYGNNYPNDYGSNGDQTQGVYSAYQSTPPTGEPPVKPKKERKILKKLAIAGGVGLCFGIFAGAGFYGVQSVTGLLNGDKNTGAVSTQAPATTQSTGIASVGNVNNITAVTTDVTAVVERAMPSLVSITNEFTEEANFFGQKIENSNQASGSGIIVGENDTELLVVTNQHVIANADALLVQFIDGEQAQAQVKGYDSEKDLAVIAVPLEKVESTTKAKISVATLGDSDALTVGEPAVAIGNALGYGPSVTTGVISALNREIEGNGKGNKLIQTDASINPGNSGGGLFNMNGEVIGINSNKIGGTFVEGMGYAIPISSARPIIEDLMSKTTKGEKVSDAEKSYLGISGVNVTEEVSQMYGLPKGVYVGQVYEGTAAEKAGLVRGDIITKFDGSSVSSMEELQSMMSYYAAGAEVEITIQQGSPSGYQEKKIKIVLGSRAEAEQ